MYYLGLRVKAIPTIKKGGIMQKKLKKDILLHVPAVLAGYLFALFAINIHGDNKFDRRQDAAVYATDDHSRDAALNLGIFSPNTFVNIEWQYQTNQRVGEIFGKTAAKEYAMDINSLKNKTATPEQKYGDVSDYCAEAVVHAYRNAESRLKFRRANKRAVPFPKERCDSLEVFSKAMKDAKYLVKYFETDSVPNSIIKNPSEEDFANINAGSIICKGRHCYMYMGIGYTDKTGRTFVANTRGRPVVAFCDEEAQFEYLDWARCTIVDVPKIVEYKLQNDVQRHVR